MINFNGIFGKNKTIILKLAKNYGFILSLENGFFGNQEGVTHVFYKIIQKIFFAKHFPGTTFAFHQRFWLSLHK